MLTDFSSDSPDLGWYVQNDNVMGGRSEGDFEEVKDELVFAGSTNTNGGGFSSIRTQPFKLDLSEHDGIQLRVKGDGRRYTWNYKPMHSIAADGSVTGLILKLSTENGARLTSPLRNSTPSSAALNWMDPNSTSARSQN